MARVRQDHADREQSVHTRTVSRPDAGLARLELSQGKGLAAALRAVPARPGVGQFLGEGERMAEPMGTRPGQAWAPACSAASHAMRSSM